MGPGKQAGNACSSRRESQLVASQECNVAYEMTTMWCVRACDAASQQYLEEETGCGQADCSIMPGVCKLHGPAAHCALAFLLDDALRSAGGNITYTKRKITIDWCPDHVVCRTRSAHAVTPSVMLFSEQKSQEFCGPYLDIGPPTSFQVAALASGRRTWLSLHRHRHRRATPRRARGPRTHYL